MNTAFRLASRVLRARGLQRWLAIAATLLLAHPSLAAVRVDLDQNWRFRADPAEQGEREAWSSVPPPDTRAVALPHTWNIGELHDFLGVGWYFARFEAPHAERVRLHFGATFYRSTVWLNGVQLGGHEGGFTAYAFDVSGKLKPSNLLAVRIDNRPGLATIPGFAERGTPQARYDWWTYGGMVRDVWLSASGAVQVERQRIRSEAQGSSWTVHDTVLLGAATSYQRPVHLKVELLDPSLSVAATSERAVSLAAGSAQVSLRWDLRAPKLWGLDRPNLYTARIQLKNEAGTLLDEHAESFGVREVKIRDRHLLLNGERIRPTGMARHEDSPSEGLAETRGTIRRDYDDMKALHTTLSRPVHYPQHPLVLDYADRHGILLIPEIPIWQFSEAQLRDPKVLKLAQAQMREMIDEAGNHPSIFAWSVANESSMASPGGIAYFRAMREFIRELDPERYVTFADDKLGELDRAEHSAARDADFLMMNQYYGSWHGPAGALPAALDNIDHLYPDKMIIISEMGFAGIFAKDPVTADQARVSILREQMPLLAARDWIGGAILWCYQDYKSPRNLWPGETEGFVEHGLVSEWRQRKPSYDVWRELNQPAHLEARWTDAFNGFVIEVTPNSVQQLPYLPLHDYRVRWRVLDAKATQVARGERALSGGAGVIEETLPAPLASGAILNAELVSPGGQVAAAATLRAAP
jgi:beta-glucuronidase